MKTEDSILTSEDVQNWAPLPIYKNPGHLARRLHQIAVSIFLDKTRDVGITPVQFASLTAARHNPGIDQRALARLIAYDRSTIGDVLQRLEKKGYLRRGPGRDGRTKSIYTTDAGEAVLDAMAEPMVGLEESLLAPLSDGERLIFLFLLRKIVRLNSALSRVPSESLLD